jgi:ankyrin repeat protein
MDSHRSTILYTMDTLKWLNCYSKRAPIQHHRQLPNKPEEFQKALSEKKDMYGGVPLLWAAENGHQVVMQELLARHVEPDEADKTG